MLTFIFSGFNAFFVFLWKYVCVCLNFIGNWFILLANEKLKLLGISNSYKNYKHKYITVEVLLVTIKHVEICCYEIVARNTLKFEHSAAAMDVKKLINVKENYQFMR